MSDSGAATRSISERADELERELAAELERIVPIRSPLYVSGDVDPRAAPDLELPALLAAGKRVNMGADPRLPRLPDRPGLLDFFELRMGVPTHLLQSATHALRAGCEEKIVLACLLHDISVGMFVRGDHGYWGAALLEPYVAEEISWAIRAHQVLRFFPDPEYGYAYPDLYIKLFGEGYRVEPYVERAYEKIRKHKWYEIARLITVNDIYSFDPTMTVSLDPFRDIVARHFRQPDEGLGWDDSPASHMWRTINWPTRFI
jgi:hypothetical protein